MRVFKRIGPGIFLGFLLFCEFGQAAAAYPLRNQWQLLLGTTVTNLEERTDAPAGFASKTSEIQGILGVKRALRMGNRVRFSPEAFLFLPWRSGVDGFSFTLTSHWSLNFDFLLSSVFSFTLGGGLLWDSHFSQGETIQVGGVAEAGTFYKPSSWVQVILPTAVGALTVTISRKVSLQVGVLIPQFYSSLKRDITGTSRLVIDL